MNKKTYLEDIEVKSFITWLQKHIKDDSLLSHHYIKPGGKLVEFQNLGDALKKYDWPFKVTIDGEEHAGNNYNDNTTTLNKLKKNRDCSAAKQLAG